MIAQNTGPIAPVSAVARANGSHQAWGIKVNHRWYVRISRRRVLTAWSLAGAQLFVEGKDAALTVDRIRKITKRGVLICRVDAPLSDATKMLWVEKGGAS